MDVFSQMKLRVIVVAALLFLAYVSHCLLPTDPPNTGNVVRLYAQPSGVFGRLGDVLAYDYGKWRISSLYVVKFAENEGRSATLVASPLTPGRWLVLDE